MATRQARPEVSVGVGDLAGIVRRRLWWLAVPAGIGSVASLILARALPPVYEAYATVEVRPQVVPEALITSTIVASAEQRFGSIKNRILTRDNLNAIIQEFELFGGDERQRDEQILEMRSRIVIEPLPPAIYDPRKPVELNTFQIAFQGPTPKQVAEVTNRLTRDFLSANLRQRAELAKDTRDFVTGELNKHRSELQTLGQEITDFKENFQGELPEQLQMNRDLLQRARLQLAAVEAQLESARSQVRAIQEQIAEMRMGGTTKADNPALRKQGLELQLQTLMAHGKTELHPDMILTRAEIERLEQVIADREATPATAGPEETRLPRSTTWSSATRTSTRRCARCS